MDNLTFLVEYGIYSNLVHIKSNTNDKDVNYFLTLTLDGIAFSDSGDLLVYNLDLLQSLEIMNVNLICLYTPNGYIITKKKEVIVKTGELVKIPDKLYTKLLELFYSYPTRKFYYSLRNLIRNSTDISYFEVNGKVLDKSGTWISKDYENLQLDRELYYRLLVKLILPYLWKNKY